MAEASAELPAAPQSFGRLCGLINIQLPLEYVVRRRVGAAGLCFAATHADRPTRIVVLLVRTSQACEGLDVFLIDIGCVSGACGDLDL